MPTTPWLCSDPANTAAPSDETRLRTNTEDIAAYARAIAANADAIIVNAGAIGVNAQGIAANSYAIDAMQADVASLNEQVAIVDRRVSQVAAIGAALNGLPANVDADGTFSVGFGVGGHEGEMGMAVGIYDASAAAHRQG